MQPPLLEIIQPPLDAVEQNGQHTHKEQVERAAVKQRPYQAGAFHERIARERQLVNSNDAGQGCVFYQVDDLVGHGRHDALDHLQQRDLEKDLPLRHTQHFAGLPLPQRNTLNAAAVNNGKIAGVRSEEEKYMIEAAAQLYCIPEVEYTMQTYIVEGRQVLVATIEETPHKPVYAKDENGKPLAYLRIKDENILATPIHLRVWQQSDSPRGELIRYTEREQLLLDQLEQGNLLSLNRYCRRTGLSRRAAEHLLAKFVRYDIVEPVFENHKFYFRIKNE
mgnify:CR=1 FL=1